MIEKAKKAEKALQAERNTDNQSPMPQQEQQH